MSRAGVSTEGTVTALNEEFGTTLDAELVQDAPALPSTSAWSTT